MRSTVTFLIRQINLFIRKGIKEIIICAGYKGKFIIDELKKYKFKNVKIKVIVEPRKLGTGGAILNIFKQLNQNFFVTYGDSWLDIDYKEIESFFLSDKKKSVLTIINKKIVPEHKANILLKNKKIVRETSVTVGHWPSALPPPPRPLPNPYSHKLVSTYLHLEVSGHLHYDFAK